MLHGPRRPCRLGCAAVAAALTASAGGQSPPLQRFAPPPGESARSWFEAGRRALEEAQARQVDTRRARNIVLFVGDGMSLTTVAAARVFAGQLRGASGEENALAFERLPWTGLLKTYNTNLQVPDSAGTMSAMMTGVKTKAGVLSVAPEVARGDAAGLDGWRLPTLLELCELSGMRTGVVTTTRLTHATPAACYAHSPDRDWESDAALARLSPTAKGFPDIAQQLVHPAVGDGLEVALGGGAAAFLPRGAGGVRADGRDLTREWLGARPRRALLRSREELLHLDAAATDQVLGLFAPSHLPYEGDRDATTPTLKEMTQAALRMLMKDDRGFFLLVEGGRIDHAHHAGNARRALEETVAFAEAVAATLEALRDAGALERTLVVVTADHSHTLTMSGYPARGMDILGLVASVDARGAPVMQPTLDALGLPYATLSYANGPGYAGKSATQPAGPKRFAHLLPPNAKPAFEPAQGRPDLTAIDLCDRDHLQEAMVPLLGETHSGEDVPLWAAGPWAHLLSGTHEQHVVFHVMAHALGLSGQPLLRVWRQVKAQLEPVDETGVAP